MEKEKILVSEISIICKKTVVSSIGQEVQEGKFYEPSVFNRIMEPYNLRIVFYYQFPSMTKLEILRKKLRISLSETLSKFPVVTGRLKMSTENNTSSERPRKIKFNDARVRMVEARDNGTLEWFQSLDREKELSLTYWEEMFYKPCFWPTFYIQITESEGGDLATGLSCTHLLADATSATMLIKAWADTNLFGKIQPPSLFHPLPPRKIGNKIENHEFSTDLINHYESFNEKSNPTTTASNNKKYSKIVFTFSHEMVTRCMSKVSRSTPFSVLVALFWVCMSKVKGKKGLIDMSICLDMRKVLGLSKEFFGNCMVFNKVFGKELKEFGLANESLTSLHQNAANVVENAVSKMNNEGIMDLIEWLDENSRDKSLTPLNGSDFICATWENLEPYSTEFEPRVEPVRVSYYLEPVIGVGQVYILPSSKCDQDGPLSRIAIVTLPQDEAVKLCEETLIVNLSPTILMKDK